MNDFSYYQEPQNKCLQYSFGKIVTSEAIQEGIRYSVKVTDFTEETALDLMPESRIYCFIGITGNVSSDSITTPLIIEANTMQIGYLPTQVISARFRVGVTAIAIIEIDRLLLHFKYNKHVSALLHHQLTKPEEMKMLPRLIMDEKMLKFASHLTTGETPKTEHISLNDATDTLIHLYTNSI